MSSNGNANYTHIQAHGIASAFEPGFIYQAATIGRPHRPAVGSSFKVADARVELGGSSAGALIVLGDALLPGCVITGIIMDGEDTLVPGVIVSVGLGEAVSPSTVPTIFTSVQESAPAVVPGVAGQDLNGGQTFAVVGFTVPEPTVPGQPLFPVLQVDPGVVPVSESFVSVKIVYFCP